jgi:arginase
MLLKLPILKVKKYQFNSFWLESSTKSKSNAIYSHCTILGGFVNQLNIITISSDFGAGKKGAYKGPQAVLNQLNNYSFPIHQIPIAPHNNAITLESDFAKNANLIVDLQENAIATIKTCFTTQNAFNLIISGDHSNGHLGISAVKEANPDKKIGVIWIDAHADLHNPGTTPSGNMHGMPLAMALGIEISGNQKNNLNQNELAIWHQLTHIGSLGICPKIIPEHLVFIELRDYEKEEADLINQYQIKTFTPDLRKELGVKTIASQALDHLSTCDLIYVSFDVDSMDPSVSKGTGTPVEGGLSEIDAIELLSILIKDPKLIALEITEINPDLDRNQPMEIVTSRIINSLLVS